MPQIERLLGPEHDTLFTKEELSWVRVEPVGEAYVFYCNTCHWGTMRREQAPVLLWDVARSGARAVVEHYKECHR